MGTRSAGSAHCTLGYSNDGRNEMLDVVGINAGRLQRHKVVIYRKHGRMG